MIWSNSTCRSISSQIKVEAKSHAVANAITPNADLNFADKNNKTAPKNNSLNKIFTTKMIDASPSVKEYGLCGMNS